MSENLIQAATNLGKPRVLVVGDLMLDVYTYGNALRISPEAPVPVLKVCGTEYACGGAASVLANLADLGAVPLCVGIAGKDKNGIKLQQLLAEAGIDTSGLLILDDRVTTTKQRLIGLAQHRHRQQLIRMDEECDDSLTEQQSKKVLEIYDEKLHEADIVCLQDYNKGLLSSSLCRQMIEAGCQADKKVIVDPCLMRDYTRYAGATLIAPNRTEASEAVGFEVASEQAAREAAKKLADVLRLQAVVITMDKEGAYLKTKDISQLVSTRPRSVYDVTGAGDMVLATLAVTLAAGCDYKTAVQLANIAGGIEVEKFGAATVSIQEIINEIISENRAQSGKVCAVDSLLQQLAWHRASKRTVVFTNGCFDVVHRGHIEFLKFCKSHGDILVVGLNSDGSVKQIKGPDRPINNQHDRASVLAALETVDYITIFEESEPLQIIKKVRPDVLVKGRDWAEKGIVGRDFLESYGGKVVLAPLVEGKSTTSVIERIKSGRKKN